MDLRFQTVPEDKKTLAQYLRVAECKPFADCCRISRYALAASPRIMSYRSITAATPIRAPSNGVTWSLPAQAAPALHAALSPTSRPLPSPTPPPPPPISRHRLSSRYFCRRHHKDSHRDASPSARSPSIDDYDRRRDPAASNDGSKQWSVGVTPLAGDTLLVGCDFNEGVSFTGVSDAAGDTFALISSGS